MNKSKGNVINPDDIVKKYGADSLSVYEAIDSKLNEKTLLKERYVKNKIYNIVVK